MSVDLSKLRVGDTLSLRSGVKRVVTKIELRPYAGHVYRIFCDQLFMDCLPNGLLNYWFPMDSDIIEIIPAQPEQTEIERELAAGTAFEGYWEDDTGTKLKVLAYFPDNKDRTPIATARQTDGEWVSCHRSMKQIKGRWKEPARKVTKEIHLWLWNDETVGICTTPPGEKDRTLIDGWQVTASRKITMEFAEGEFDE